MLSKPITFILVYILSVCNFVVILLPLLFIFLPILFFDDGKIANNSATILLLSISVVSLLVLFFLLIDFIFAFSIRSLIKGCKDYTKIKEYIFLTDIFEEVKTKFNKQNVNLLIEPSKEVNAFAVGGLRKNYIILTDGIIFKYSNSAQNREEFLESLKGVLGHEMSHLVNKDYLPGLLLKVDEQATIFLSKIVFLIFNIIIRLLNIVPIINRILVPLLLNIYKFIDFLLSFFHKYVVYTIYKFIQLQISKSIEYRCDKQSAELCGGLNMAKSLSFLGSSGYFTIFSTHPSTESRIKNVQNITKTNKNIKVSFINNIVNFLSVVSILFIAYICFERADLKSLIKDYNTVESSVRMFLFSIKYKLQNLFPTMF